MIGIDADAWLSRVMQTHAFRVDARRPGVGDQIAAHASNYAQALYYAKVDTKDVAAACMLGAAGFYVVDVNVTLEAAPAVVIAACAAGHRDGLRVDPCGTATAPGVLDIAGSAFEYSRFHLDPAIPRPVADRIKREWIQSYVDGARGDRLFVAVDGERPIGFLAALTAREDEQRVTTIDLVGVARDQQRRGVGRALVGAFAAHYGSEARLRVGTQAANLPSLGLYERLGFVIARTAYVLHFHSGKKT